MYYSAVLCLLTAAVAQAQTEAVLKAFFEGKRTLVKLDLPAGKEGVDIYPKSQPMVNVKRYSIRLSRNGPALLRGDSATVMAVRVKRRASSFSFPGAHTAS